MGRGKLAMELIRNEKKMEKTFQKRKKGLIKKAHEFTILTGVKMGIIIYGPQLATAGSPAPPPEIWPADPVQVRLIIDEFINKKSRGAKGYALPDYLVRRLKTVHDAATNARKANHAVRFSPRWDDRFDALSLTEIQGLITKLDSILDATSRRKAELKSMTNQRLVPADHHSYSYMMMPEYNLIPASNHPMMVPMDGLNFSHHQLGGGASSAAYSPFSLSAGYHDHIPLPIMAPAPLNYDLAPLPLQAASACNYCGPSMEPFRLQDQRQQSSTMFSITSSQLHVSQFDVDDYDYHGMNDQYYEPPEMFFY